jgi:hypothetical protein
MAPMKRCGIAALAVLLVVSGCDTDAPTATQARAATPIAGIASPSQLMQFWQERTLACRLNPEATAAECRTEGDSSEGSLTVQFAGAEAETIGVTASIDLAGVERAQRDALAEGFLAVTVPEMFGRDDLRSAIQRWVRAALAAGGGSSAVIDGVGVTLTRRGDVAALTFAGIDPG